MHELHLLRQLVDDITNHAAKEKAAKITKVYILLGIFTEINPEILKYYFKEHTKGTILENAEIDIQHSDKRELRLLSFDCE